jgi:hypothetical protein
MMQHSLQFGYYPDELDFTSGAITISTLAGLNETVSDIEQLETLDNGWVYPSLKRSQDFLSREITLKPYPSRIFPLPKTHEVLHQSPDCTGHLNFHVWALSFFLGIRLTTEEAGFLDTTPIKPGKLTDFVLLGSGINNVAILAEDFWVKYRAEPENAKRWVAAVHALFLAQNPQLLQFEKFIYLYTAIDACFALAKATNPSRQKPSHAERINWLCQSLGMETPTWATTQSDGKSIVADIRNLTLHEALFMNEPLGFAIHRAGNLTLEMQALICRFLVALLGSNDQKYIASPTNTRQRHGLQL